MGYKIGMPSLKLNGNGRRSKKCGSFMDVSKEAFERIGRDPDIDHTRSYLNIIQGYSSTEELMAYSREHIAEMEARNGHKVRKDAVLMCVTIIKPPVAEMVRMPYEEQRRILDESVKSFGSIVDSKNVKSVVMHFDEQGPHAHIFWEPITSDGRLCAKEMHNRDFFRKVNEIIPKALRKAGFDVDVCEMYDLAEKEYDQERKKNSGRTSAQFKRDMEAEKHRLQTEIDQKEQELEKKSGELLKIEQVAEVKPRKSLLTRKDMVELSAEDFLNLRTTALKVEQVENQILEFEQFKNQTLQAMKRLKFDLTYLEARKMKLVEEIAPLEERAAKAHSIIDKATGEADYIRETARIKGKEQGISDGYLAAYKIEENAKNEAKGIIKSAEKEAGNIIDRARSDAKKIIDADYEHACRAVAFYDEIMSVEGEGDFYRFRKNPAFWLDVEEYMTREVPILKKTIEELKGIISFIPNFIVSRARRFFEHFGHEREWGEPDVSLDEGIEHDRDGLEEHYSYSYGRSR